MSATPQTFAVHAACIRGVEAFEVTVEISSSGTIPGMTIVGMADAAVMDARSRIRCALRSSGFMVPRCTLTVSLAPGDVRKTGSGLDLPIAVAILALSGQIPLEGLDDCLFVGELASMGPSAPSRARWPISCSHVISVFPLLGDLTPSMCPSARCKQVIWSVSVA